MKSYVNISDSDHLLDFDYKSFFEKRNVLEKNQFCLFSLIFTNILSTVYSTYYSFSIYVT